MVDRVEIPEKIKNKVILKSSNACCICQTPFVQIHHIDGNPANNEVDNLVALCPNHHTLAHAHSNMFRNLNPSVLKAFRDKWYIYCEARAQNFESDQKIRNGICILKVKNFARKMGFADFSWSRTFASLDENYREMKQPELIDHLFSTSNPEDLRVYLETLMGLYSNFKGYKQEVVKDFEELCNCFGFGYENSRVVYQRVTENSEC